MFQGLFNNLTDTEKNDAIADIIQHASPRKDFFLMMILSVGMASFGIILNSVVVLIGSMLIAPLLYPILSLGLGIITYDRKLMNRSIITLGKSTLFSLITAFVVGFLFAPRNTILSFSLFDSVVTNTPSLVYAIIAAIAGFAATFAITKSYLNNALPGVAISVALVPPLATTGIGFALWDWALISGALSLFIVNIIGILFSAMIVFSLMRFAFKKHVTQEAVKEEDKVIKKESAPVK